jgi:non-specific serine/threonine protein kinase
LLTAEEQALFRQLSTFAGGFSLDAVEAVYQSIHEKREVDGEKEKILTMITSLFDQSFIQQTAGEGEEPRLGLLETIREYGRECLQACGELEQVQRAHAKYYLAFAEQGERYLCPRDVKDGGQQLLWLARFNRDQENLRTAILWFLQHQEPEEALRLYLATAWYFLWTVGNWEKLIGWYETALAQPDACNAQAEYTEVLAWLGYLKYMMWRHKGQSPSSSLECFEKSVHLLRELGEK